MFYLESGDSLSQNVDFLGFVQRIQLHIGQGVLLALQLLLQRLHIRLVQTLKEFYYFTGHFCL